ncbi:restriction endonuclease subunit S [uncultured Prevotella sp.]|uniref:restriction endonuclease subunit S n=1 Tax=uncultured Prevotella sp. TaxID=159272 RepID=UPI00267271FE|nr:restriction endonuclease subunit S [uncultured Prevotella sp.]
MTTTINNKHKKLNFSSEREQSQACLNSAEHEKNQGRKVLNVPNLRFPEFQGEWEKKRLEECVEFLDGLRKPIKSEDRKSEQGLYPYYGASGIIDYIDGYLFDGEYILLSEDGANIIDRNYRVAFIAKGKIWVNNHAHVLQPYDGFDINFLSETLERLNYAVYNTGTTMPKLNQEVCRNINLKIPTTKEQNKIGNLLSLLNERIATQNKIIDKLQSLIKGIRNKLFENDKDWRKAKIREFLCIGNGKDYKHLDIGDIPVYGTGGKMLSVNDFLYDGDSVCIGRKGTIDTPLFLTGKFWTVDTLFYTYGFKDVLPKFCYYLFKQINWQLYNEGTGVPSLSKSTIENIKVRIPSIVQQYKICYILDSYEDKIKNEGLILDLYCSQKQYLLRQMFV